MPVYEYKCKNCNERITVKQGIKDPHLVVCPHCGQESLERLISLSGFELKGSGWFGRSADHNPSTSHCSCDNCPHKR